MTSDHTFSPLLTLRAERRLSQEQVAARAGLSPAGVSRIERGLMSPRPTTQLRLAAALGVPVSQLFPASAARHGADGRGTDLPAGDELLAA